MNMAPKGASTARTKVTRGGTPQRGKLITAPSSLQTPLLKYRRPGGTMESWKKVPHAGLTATSSMNPGHEAPWQPELPHRPGRILRPFSPLESLLEQYPKHLESRRFAALPTHEQAGHWTKRREHAPLDLKVSPSWGLDAFYLRHREEKGYLERLRVLRPSPGDGVALNLIRFPQPWVPYTWPAPPYPPKASHRTFPRGGDVADPIGGYRS